MKGIDISNLEDITFFIRRMIWKERKKKEKYGVYQLTLEIFPHVLNVGKKSYY